MEHRNRAEGWKHAKITGHENEELVKKLFDNEGTFQQDFLTRLHKENCKIVDVKVGGLNEKNVESILGNTTKSKTDLKVVLDDGTVFNISIKKSLGGQVYLIAINHFIDGYEKQYNETIPSNVKRAIELFWGSANDTIDIINNFGTNKTYEKRKHRIVSETLKTYDIELYNCLLKWFKEHIANIFDFCFSKGLAKDSSEWSNVVWYVNKLGENNIDEMFLLDDIKNYLKSISDEDTYYGNREHGSTIQLPFGFVQWHSPTKVIPGCLQFHHKYDKIKKSKKKND